MGSNHFAHFRKGDGMTTLTDDDIDSTPYIGKLSGKGLREFSKAIERKVIAAHEAKQAGEAVALSEKLKVVYCRMKGADSTVGLDCCDDYKEWLDTLTFANPPKAENVGSAITQADIDRAYSAGFVEGERAAISSQQAEKAQDFELPEPAGHIVRKGVADVLPEYAFSWTKTHIHTQPVYTAEQMHEAVAKYAEDAAMWREKAYRLWMLLDDVDTADDIAKADDKLYRGICQQAQAERWHHMTGDEIDAARGKA